MGRGKRREPLFSLSPSHRAPRAFYFFLPSLPTTQRCLCGGESSANHLLNNRRPECLVLLHWDVTKVLLLNLLSSINAVLNFKLETRNEEPDRNLTRGFGRDKKGRTFRKRLLKIFNSVVW